MDDFMRGLYLSSDKETSSAGKPKNVMAALMTGQGLDDINTEKKPTI